MYNFCHIGMEIAFQAWTKKSPALPSDLMFL